MNMKQTRILYEHYDSKSWAGIIAGLIIAASAVVHLIIDKDFSVANILLHVLTVIPPVLILVVDAVWKNKPLLVVYNDRLEVRITSGSRRDEIMYSDIRNMALESGQLRIWRDDISAPSCYNLGYNAVMNQEAYDALRAAFDKYNQEHDITPVPVDRLPKKNSMVTAVMIVTMVAVIAFLVFLRIS